MATLFRAWRLAAAASPKRFLATSAGRPSSLSPSAPSAKGPKGPKGPKGHFRINIPALQVRLHVVSCFCPWLTVG